MFCNYGADNLLFQHKIMRKGFKKILQVFYFDDANARTTVKLKSIRNRFEI